MPRPARRDEWDDTSDDRLPSRRRTEGRSLGGTLLAAAGFGLTLIAGGVIGFAAGRSPRDAEKPRPLEVAENTPPVTRPPVPTPAPPPTPEPKPEVKKPEAKKAEPPKKKADPPKPVEPPKKVEPPKPPEPKKPDSPPQAGAVSFQKDVFPIFKAKCNSCHGDAGNPKGDLDLRTLAKAVKGGDNGPGAKPGKPDDSQIWLTVDNGSMPPAGKEKLTDAEKKMIKDWILAGAK